MRLLLVEDERELSKALVTILKHHNYSVDAAYDGEEALLFLENEDYDAVILDIMMPKLDGISTLKQLRKNGNPIPVLMLTAKSELDDRVAGLDAGADDYLSKPFEAKELIARIRAITRRKSEFINSTLCYGNITLNRTTFELKSPTGQFHLTNKEFQMLEILMINHGILISTERFLDKIWGYDSDSEINVVWVYISYLRKKLASLDANIQIKATRGAGYSLVLNHD